VRKFYNLLLNYIYKVDRMGGETLRDALYEVKTIPGVISVMLVSRTGMFVEGDRMDRRSMDTFSAMAAIVLGASETATTEIEEKVRYVVLELEKSKLVILGTGIRGVLIVRVKRDFNNVDAILEASKGVGQFI
jgi:hypothetical protein